MSGLFVVGQICEQITRKRMLLPLSGALDVKFYTKAGTLIAVGYEGVVIGERGPYVEFRPDHRVCW